MKITSVQIHGVPNLGAIQAFANIILDDELIIKGLVIIKDKTGIHSVKMPDKDRKDPKTGTHYRHTIIRPLSEACHLYIETTVLDEYERLLNLNSFERAHKLCAYPK